MLSADHIKAITEAKFCVFTCGAGMSADSGIPTYRDPNGFWRDYPKLAGKGLHYGDVMTPDFMRAHPSPFWEVAWDMVERYRQADAHAGYGILLKWAKQALAGNLFVITSNVDGAFAKAGLPPSNLMEIHGNKHYLQCDERCTEDVWLNTENPAVSPIPKCRHCGGLARPNVVMFWDDTYLRCRQSRQEASFEEFQRVIRRHNPGQGVVIEVGAGTGIPIIRNLSHMISRELEIPMIRVNLFDAGCNGLSVSALSFFEGLDSITIQKVKPC